MQDNSMPKVDECVSFVTEDLGIVHEAKTYEELIELINSMFCREGYSTSSGYVIAYLDYKVLIGRYDGQSFEFYENEQFEPKYLQKLRVFDENREVLMWRKGENTFKSRTRIDGEGDPVDYIQAEQVLWGIPTEEKLYAGWSKMSEARGAELILPIDELYLKVGPRGRVKIVTRNYIGFNDLGQAGFVDCRFVKFRWVGDQVG